MTVNFFASLVLFSIFFVALYSVRVFVLAMFYFLFFSYVLFFIVFSCFFESSLETSPLQVAVCRC